MEPINHKARLTAAEGLIKGSKYRQAHGEISAIIADLEQSLGEHHPLFAEAYHLRYFASLGVAKRTRKSENLRKWIAAGVADYKKAVHIWNQHKPTPTLVCHMVTLGTLCINTVAEDGSSNDTGDFDYLGSALKLAQELSTPEALTHLNLRTTAAASGGLLLAALKSAS